MRSRSLQALASYLQLEARHEEPLRSYQAVLDGIWAEQVASGPDGPARAALATEIADVMSERETLWLPAARFEDRQPLMDDLVARRGLVRNATGSGFGFSHQILLDHAVARRFVTESSAAEHVSRDELVRVSEDWCPLSPATTYITQAEDSRRPPSRCWSTSSAIDLTDIRDRWVPHHVTSTPAGRLDQAHLQALN